VISNEQYKKVTEEIEKAHSADESKEAEEGAWYPSELLYSRRMLTMLELVSPNSPNTMKLAVQCQHIKRWGIPRSDYPYDRRGYHQWRRVVMEYQLQQAQFILSSVNIDEADMLWIIDTLKNQGDKSNSESQIIVETACLVFLKWYMEPFAAKHESEKVIDIVKKTMRKMSETGLKLIPKLDLPMSVRQVLQQAAHSNSNRFNN
jgi:hypothetical protein